MAAIPFAATFKISPPPPLPALTLRRPHLRPPPSPTKLASARPSSSVEIASATECSDGSVLFRFTDAEDSKRQGEGLLDFREETESRESKDKEIGEKMEGAVESSDLGAENEVVEQGLGSGDSDGVSEKTVDVILSSGIGTVGLESEMLEEIEASDGGAGLKIEDDELSVKTTGSEVKSDIVQSMSDSVEVCEMDESVKAEVLDSESELGDRRVCLGHESSALDAQRQLLEETLAGDQEEQAINVETTSESPKDDKVSSVELEELESPESAEGGQEIRDIALQSDEVLEEEKISDVGVEQKGEPSDGILLVEEQSAVGDDNVQIDVSEMSEELLDDALVSKERFEDGTEASEVSMTIVADLDMGTESSSVPVEEDGGDGDTAETSVAVPVVEHAEKGSGSVNVENPARVSTISIPTLSLSSGAAILPHPSKVEKMLILWHARTGLGWQMGLVNGLLKESMQGCMLGN